ncbi:MAG: site-specific DNA-methyltransferase [Anaerolineales bacterium]|nr:site-specific DNA-methyltransferase [Anaerolineales bacterium]
MTEKLDLTSHNLPADKTAELLRLFPEIRTESNQIDFDKLRLVLGQTVDVGKERYGMTWPGKADCFKTIQTHSTGTLLPAPDESVDFDTTENLIIEGDNLNVLKLLQKAYLGKVKMIYIDPPYNTGNDFIYPDNYAESLQTYLEYTKQVDAEGRKFGTNTDTDGRFHSRWLNMMYPRLYLARNLLKDDGVIFISIDDNEAENLRKLCDEIFGEENFVASIVWQRTFATKNDAKFFSSEHENILVYTKNIENLSLNLLERGEKQNARYTNPDIDPRGVWVSTDLLRMEHRDNSVYEIVSPTGKVWKPQPGTSWRHPEPEILELIKNNEVTFGADGNAKPRRKRFLKDVKQGIVPQTIWKHDDVGHTQDAKQGLNKIFDGIPTFDTPKPVKLIRRCLQLTTSNSENDLVLDFFAGSGTTAQSVIEQNLDDEGNRRFIIVQLPEICAEDSEARKAGFSTISDVMKERVRRVIKKINNEEAGQFQMGEKQDRGFRVFKLSESNFKGWESAVPKDGSALVQQLEMHIDHIRDGRTSEDILYEILLKSGYPLTTPIKTLRVSSDNKLVNEQDDSVIQDEGQQRKPIGSIYSVADGGMLICLEKDLTLEVIRAMAELKPQRVICLDAGFAEDQLKANAVQIFKTKDIVFKTV